MQYTWQKRSFFYKIFYFIERLIKEILFQCSMCGQCAVRGLGLTCPMRCPKQLRNGPCGGSMNGICETDPKKKCVWYLIAKRSKRMPIFNKTKKIKSPIDWSLFHTAAWDNLFKRRISIDGDSKNTDFFNKWRAMIEKEN